MTNKQIKDYGSEPATACVGYGNMGDSFHQQGITIMEHFAGLAMQGILKGCNHGDIMDIKNNDYGKLIADASVKIACDLIEALDEKNKALAESELIDTK